MNDKVYTYYTTRDDKVANWLRRYEYPVSVRGQRMVFRCIPDVLDSMQRRIGVVLRIDHQDHEPFAKAKKVWLEGANSKEVGPGGKQGAGVAGTGGTHPGPDQISRAELRFLQRLASRGPHVPYPKDQEAAESLLAKGLVCRDKWGPKMICLTFKGGQALVETTDGEIKWRKRPTERGGESCPTPSRL